MQIREMRPEEHDEATKLLHSRLGTDCSIPPQNPGTLILVCEHEGKLIGVATALICEKYGSYLGSAVVSEEHSGEGIGTELVRRRLEWLDAQGVRAVHTWAWIGKKGANAEKTLLRNGFILVETLPGHFSYCKDCPDCRPGPYNCGAYHFVKRMD